MSLLQTLRAKLTECRKAGKHVELSVLQVVLGDASTLEARSGKPASDEEVEKLIRKTMLGNQETLDLIRQKGVISDMAAKLTAENVYLQTLLPQTLSVDEILAELAVVADAVKGAKNDGQATGVAMKQLRSRNLKVLGDDVAGAVRRLRGTAS
jgi:uncharacterized protein YqeY